MFREHYKQAYSKIEGDRTQIAKILAMAQEPPKKKKVFVPFRMITTAAAALILGISLYSARDVLDMSKPVQEQPKADVVISETAKTKTEIHNAAEPKSKTQSKDVAYTVKQDDATNQQNASQTQQPEQAENTAASAPKIAAEQSEDVVPMTVAYDLLEEDTDAAAPVAAPQEEAMPENTSRSVSGGATRTTTSGFSDSPVYQGVAGGGSSASGAAPQKNIVPLKSYSHDFENESIWVDLYDFDNYNIQALLKNNASKVLNGCKTVVANGCTYIETTAFYIQIEADWLTDAQITQIIINASL